MKDDIKEILDSIQEHLKEKEENFKKGAVDSTVYYLYCDNARTLLDYITNLQEQLHQASLDIQELTERDVWCPSNCDKLTNLQEELKEANESITWWSNRFKAVEKENAKLKQEKDKYYEENLIISQEILNLQEENIKLNIKLEDKAYEQLKASYKKLQEENDKLKSDLECYENGVYFSSENDKLQNKIDKAIDKLYCYGEAFDTKIMQQFQKEMLGILQGEDNE